MSVQQMQIHNKFKVFEGNSIADIARTIRMFTAGGAIAAKSVAVDYVESTGKFLLCLGYAENQRGYPVKISEAVAGPVPTNGDTDPLSAAIDAQAAAIGNIMGHDFYVDSEGIVHLVFMEFVFE